MTSAEPLKTMEEVRAEAEEQGYRYCYGSLFPPNYNSRGQMVGLMQDWQVEAHCLRADDPWDGFATVEEGERPKEYQGYVAHFMAFVSALWPNFEWNPNAVKICKELFAEGRQFLGVAGHGSCVAGNTRLLDPRTGNSPTIKELCDSGTNPCVMTLNGPRMASVPFKKGRRELFEVCLSNGRKFKSTDSHRVLTGNGWIPVSEMSPGDDLLGYEPVLQESSLAPAPLTREQDVPRYSGTPEGLKSHCCVSPRLCGEQLPMARAAARDASPSPDDAQGCSASQTWHKDAQGREQLHTHSRSTISLSTHDEGDPSASVGNRTLHCSSPETFELLEALFLQSSLSDSLKFPPPPVSGLDPHFGHKHNKDCASFLPEGSSPHGYSICERLFCTEEQVGPTQVECSSESQKETIPSDSSPDFCSTSYEWNVQKDRVLSIQKIGEEDFYDLHVPGEHHYFAEGAIHHNSGKTEALAYFAVAFFLIDPKNTMCIVTSKTVEIAQKKIWGSVRRAWNQLKTVIPENQLPGELTMKAITYIDITTGDQDPQRGLMLMPGEQSQYRKSADKYQGMKAPFLMVAADELATLSPAIVETAISNLTKGASDVKLENGRIRRGKFKFAGSFNPETHHDASRKVAMPKAGWGSITVNDMEWETELGYCIRFDGLKSPNVLDGKATWTGLYTREMLEKDLVHYHGEKTAGFWTMVRGFWPPMGIEDAIYSSQEIETYRGEWMEEKGFHWLEAPIRCAGLDPSYRPGGDRAVLYFGLCGLASFDDKRVQMVFQFGDPLGPQISPGYLILAEDVTKAQDKSRQVAEALKCECEKRSIRIENVGIDITGASAFGSLVRIIWGDGFLEINFAESASEAAISATDPMPANERYSGRLSELWYSGKYLLWSEQLKGISPDLAQEMVSRSFTDRLGKITVEPKDKMKIRIGKSPDISDAAFCALDVARQRLNLVSNAQNTKTKEQEKAGEDGGFTAWARRMGLQGAAIQSLVYES